MNRVIKFRAFDKSDGRMLSVVEPEEQGKREYYPFEVQVGFSHFKKEDIVLMQFTGLKDLDGNEIYEGDLMTYFSNSVPKQVVFMNGSFGVLTPYNDGSGSTFGSYEIDRGKIVGNIYENPDLLN